MFDTHRKLEPQHEFTSKQISLGKPWSSSQCTSPLGAAATGGPWASGDQDYVCHLCSQEGISSPGTWDTCSREGYLLMFVSRRQAWA